MESPETRNDSSPDASPKQFSPRRSPIEENTGENTHIRFLVSNAEAGSVIGKGGSTISDFQSQSGARIHLSRNHEFFPGTSDRVVTVSGTIDDIFKAVDLILSKLLDEFYGEDGDDVEPRSYLRLIVPNSSCGCIIGKGGATIRSFMEDSQAGIKISPQDNSYHGPNNRLVIIHGTIDEQMRAIDLILSKLAEDPHYVQSFSIPFPYAGRYVGANHVPNGAGLKFQHNKVDRNNLVTIGVADEHIGLVVGRGGRNLVEITQVSGARIKVSDRGDFISGTSNRKVTITGSQRAIRVAEDMISQRVTSASERVIE